MRFHLGEIWRGEGDGHPRRAVVVAIDDEGRKGKLHFEDGGKEWFLFAQLTQMGKWHLDTSPPLTHDNIEITVHLQRSPDDPRVNQPEFQQELSEFSQSLRAAGVTSSQRAMAFDSIDAVGFPLPEFVIVLGPAIVTALGVACVAWIQGRNGRKIRLKVGDVEAEARTPEEIDGLLASAVNFRAIDREKSDNT